MRTVVAGLCFLALASACFNPVGEAQCATDADCMSGQACVDFRCRTPDGGAAVDAGDTTDAGSNAGGSAGGGGAMGGGTAGSAGGGMAGGSAVDAGTCGCRTGGGQCQAGDSPLACGTAGNRCTRCGTGEQCVNGECVMAACGPGTCSGCCGPRNTCITPSFQTGFSCGQAGAMCTQCPMGQDCINGTCQPAQACGPVTCGSGCCAFGRCLPPSQQQNFACGTGGGMCQQCGGGSRCVNGTCQGGGAPDAGMPNTCDAVSCPSGCCAFGRCITQQSNFTCGLAGAMCQQCQGGTSCRMGACLPAMLPDGGTPQVLPAGSACNATSLCDGTCLEEAPFGQPTGYPGGYCTATCGPNQPCASGACVTESVFGTMASSCRSTCPAPGSGQSTCRTGYVCALAPNPGALLGYCRPNCNNGSLAACPQGQQCQANGFCM
ncbi:MAG: hypothetical protein MUC96_09390 [Myxococcaceae bacterium]|nr:hypothetical protein [Myxococcaceae bacterium]